MLKSSLETWLEQPIEVKNRKKLVHTWNSYIIPFTFCHKAYVHGHALWVAWWHPPAPTPPTPIEANIGQNMCLLKHGRTRAHSPSKNSFRLEAISIDVLEVTTRHSNMFWASHLVRRQINNKMIDPVLSWRPFVGNDTIIQTML
jgi:hypothetical protein